MNVDDYKTLPGVAVELGASLDALRLHLRRNINLKMLGRVFGAVRVYGPQDVNAIRASWESRRKPALA